VVVVPEPANVRVRVEHSVLELSAHPLDLAAVDILGRVAVGVYPNWTPLGIGGLLRPEWDHKHHMILDVTADRHGRLNDDACSGAADLE
jgi:hypothetical protein